MQGGSYDENRRRTKKYSTIDIINLIQYSVWFIRCRDTIPPMKNDDDESVVCATAVLKMTSHALKNVKVSQNYYGA